jgi:hypothetical protein
MLFVLDETVETCLSQERGPSIHSEGIDILCRAAFEGKHLLTGHRLVLRSLSANTNLQAASRVTLAAALSSVENDLALKNDVSVFARVEGTDEDSPRSERAVAQRMIRIPLKWIDDTSKVQATVILGENLVDAEVIELIVAVARHLDGGLALPIKARRMSGGGNTTAQVFDHLAKHHTLCICVVDSDQKCPLGPLGDTARALSGGNNLTRYPLAAVTKTVGRDLENVLPNAFYESAYGGDVNHQPMVHLLKSLTASGEHELRAHIDIREGLKLRDLFRLGKGGPDYDFWSQKLPVLANIMGIKLDALPCHSKKACASESNETCQCRVLSGNRDKILERFVQTCRSAGHEGVATMLDSSTRAEWRRLGKLTFDWCCASARIRS